jgi:hypothetical protein
MPVMEVECSNTSSGWKYLDHLKLVFNDIGLDNFNSNEINSNIFKTFFESCIRFGLVWFGLWCLMSLQQYLSYIVAVRFTGGGNHSTPIKPQTCRKSLTNFIT